MIVDRKDNYAPWLSDPDDPTENLMTADQAAAAAQAVAALYPDLVDRSLDRQPAPVDKTRREDNFAPWLSDPDDPNTGLMSSDDAHKSASIVAILHPELVDHSMDRPINPRRVRGKSIAAWGAILARDEKKRIDTALRSGLVGGLNSTALARKVLGSAQIRGVDGVTEITRRKIALLGKAAIKRK
jgi:hypothetical protein